MKRREFAIGLALLMACYLTQFTVATATRKVEPTKFTVRVENISNPEGMTASNGQKFPFALSPGMFVLSDKTAPLFTEGKPARKNGRNAVRRRRPVRISGLARGNASQLESAWRLQYTSWRDGRRSNPPR